MQELGFSNHRMICRWAWLLLLTSPSPTRKLVAAGAFGRFITVSQQKDLEEASCLLGVFSGEMMLKQKWTLKVVGKPEARSKPSSLWMRDAQHLPSLSLLLLILLRVKEIG